MRAALLGLLWSARVWACASCAATTEELVGVSPEGVVVVAGQHSTGESDASEVWSVRLVDRNGLVCVVTTDVMESGERRSLGGPQPSRCDQLPGVGRKQVVEGLRRRLRLTPFVPTAPPPVELPPVENADGYGHEPQPIRLRGAVVATSSSGSSRWFVTAYRNPRWDGVVLRLITLLSDEDTRVGSQSSCSDYSDEYHPITPSAAGGATTGAARRPRTAGSR
jgi:hypothetical protein